MRYILDNLGYIESISCNQFNCEGKSKNFLNLSSFATKTLNGVTITNNGNGSITFNGTASIGFGVNFVKLALKKGTYHLSLNANTPNDFYVYNYNTNASVLNKEQTATFTEDLDNIGFDTWINQGVVFNNLTIFPQLELGSVTTPFSPYGIVKKSCNEYKGTIPSGYDTLEEWATTANIRAYKIISGNLVYDEARNTELENEWEKCKNGYVVLYENESGTIESIDDLTEDVEKYSYIEIFYSKNSEYFCSVKVPNFAYHSVCLMYSYRDNSSDLTQIGTKVVSFSGKKMTSGQAGGINIFGSSGYDAYSSNEIFIHRIIGYM
jgi:hypothetical protein